MTPDSPSDPELQGPAWAGLTDVGQGAPILAIHGLPGSGRDFRWLGTVLEANARFIRLDLPGFGGTPMNAGPRTHEVAAFVARVIDEYIGEPVTLIGHSFGSTDAAAIACHFPDLVARVALLAPFPIEPHRGYRQAPNFEAVRRGMRIPLLKKVLTPKVIQGYQAAGFRYATAQDAMRTFDRLAHFKYARHRLNIENMPQSTFIAWADDDPFIEGDLVAKMAALAPKGPRLRYKTGGHNIQKSQAVEMGEAMLNWIEET